MGDLRFGRILSLCHSASLFCSAVIAVDLGRAQTSAGMERSALTVASIVTCPSTRVPT